MKSIKILIVGALLISACSEDYLTLEPQATLFSSEYFKTADQVEESLISAYDVLGQQLGANLAWAPPLLCAEVLSDDAFAGGQDAGDGALQDEFNTFNISTTNELARSLWKKNYFGVFRSNFTIEKAEPLLAGDDGDLVLEYTAEARFLRAYFYFELVRFFENVPLITEVANSISESNQPQADPEDVYNLIAEDLVFAIENLPERIRSSRVSRWAAQALLARVYLFKNGVYGGDLDADGLTVDQTYCLEQLEDLITRSGHDLIGNYDSLFYPANEYSIESVFEIAHGDSPVLGDWGNGENRVEGNLAAQMMGPRAAGSGSLWYRGWAFGIISNKLYQDMLGDPRLDATILTETTILATGATLNTGSYQYTGYYNNKYTTRNINKGAQGSLELFNTTNYRVIRYSDVLLMASELAQNTTYLNIVRNRVGLGPIGAYSETVLFNERRMELSGEGLRYFDLLRRGLSLAQQELSVTGDIGSDYTGSPAIYDVTFNASTRGFLPIPQTEIDLSNGVLKQNDGY